MNTYRHLAAVLAAAAAVAFFGVPGANAEESLSANDLQPAQITALTPFDGFTVLAKADKGVTVETIDAARTAADGEVFNARIKLNGGGSAEYRSIRFKAHKDAEIVVYLNSSSKTDARPLKVVDASGAVVAELAAPPDGGTEAGMGSFKAPADGEYTAFSAASGINIYAIAVR